MRSLASIFLIGVEDVTEIWLVRHADCYDNITEPDDPPLSELGREQAARLAERIKKIKPAAVYSSPYRRAVQTAEMLTDDVRVDPRLVEMALDVGEDGSLELHELPNDVVSRMRAVIDEAIEQHATKRVVIVSHGAAIIAYLTNVLQLDPGRLRMLPYYTSVSIIRALGDRRIAGTLCDVAHLE